MTDIVARTLLSKKIHVREMHTAQKKFIKNNKLNLASKRRTTRQHHIQVTGLLPYDDIISFSK